ncbi:VOC family protein [Fibrella aquatilis]|uniref:VOC family protein n=1 Tax=Fibrella aquatilis TaxID=2817059 RepID=A0A939G8F1_9BACT|nr:VOC family protein [Fibrella aquatilis]MBO0931971.1 VOC family protein [Fibrella aquatilis]
MNTLQGIHHAALSVSDLDETINWYREKLGFTEEFRYEFPPEMKTKAAFVRLGELRIELFEVTGADPVPPTSTDFASDLHVRGMKHMGLRVANVDAARAELEQRGVTFVTPTGDVPNSNGARYAFFHDNNRVLIELYQPSAHS